MGIFDEGLSIGKYAKKDKYERIHVDLDRFIEDTIGEIRDLVRYGVNVKEITQKLLVEVQSSFSEVLRE